MLINDDCCHSINLLFDPEWTIVYQILVLILIVSAHCLKPHKLILLVLLMNLFKVHWK